MNRNRILWNLPTETPECFDVIVKQEGCQIQQAGYFDRPLPVTGGGTIEPGFYVLLGDGRVIRCERVIGWIPLPQFGNENT